MKTILPHPLCNGMRAGRALWPALALAVVLALTGCGSSRQATPSYSHRGGGKPTAVVKPPKQGSVKGSAGKLLAQAETWLGVPYKYGGADKSGADCSGFVMKVCLEALDISLPRTSASQSEWCSRHVDRSQLKPGDLVFFDTSGARNGKVSHVGVYVGDGTMIHSSTSKGVIYTSIDTDYYTSRFLSGGRILTDTDKQKPDRPKAETARKPERREAASTTATQPQPQPQPAKASAPATPASDARAKVLGNLIEQKIDSIYNHDSSASSSLKL